jgi:hypothetical protein
VCAIRSVAQDRHRRTTVASFTSWGLSSGEIDVHACRTVICMIFGVLTPPQTTSTLPQDRYRPVQSCSDVRVWLKTWWSRSRNRLCTARLWKGICWTRAVWSLCSDKVQVLERTPLPSGLQFGLTVLVGDHTCFGVATCICSSVGASLKGEVRKAEAALAINAPAHPSVMGPQRPSYHADT